MQNQITTYNEAISKYNAIIIGSSVATALGPIAIIGGAVVIATGAGTPLGIALIAGGAGAIGGGTAGIVLAKKNWIMHKLKFKNNWTSYNCPIRSGRANEH